MSCCWPPGKGRVVRVSGSKVWCETIIHHLLYQEWTVVCNQTLEGRMADLCAKRRVTCCLVEYQIVLFFLQSRAVLRYNIASAATVMHWEISFFLFLLFTVFSSCHLCLLFIVRPHGPFPFAFCCSRRTNPREITIKMQNNRNSRQYWFIYQACTYWKCIEGICLHFYVISAFSILLVVPFCFIFLFPNVWFELYFFPEVSNAM